MKPFIPSWLNQAGLSQAEFRVYACLCSRADNQSGLAWPNADTISRDCGMARNTVWKVLRSLEQMKFIRRSGKPFGGSTRYQILTPAISANETPVESSISANDAPIETPTNRRKSDTPIGANQILQSAQIRRRECNPKNVIQRRLSNTILPFDSDEFGRAWERWEQHRREKRKPLTPTSVKLQLEQLADWGEARAIAAINNSIAAGWQGIFEPKDDTRPKTVAVDTGRRTPNIIEI